MNQALDTRAVLPLALLTAVAMLATDLYLPAVPSLPETLGGTIEQAQYTLSGFLASLAIGQLLWGWTSDRFSETFTIVTGTALLIVGGIACALAPNIYVLIFSRIAQGLGAGAAAVAVPSLVRKRYGEINSVKALAAIASIEAIIPAAGPIFGALLMQFFHWRISFALLAGTTLLLVPFIIKVTKSHQTPSAPTYHSSYIALFGNCGFLRFALSYAIMFGALIFMVMSAPQIIVSWFQMEVYYFSFLQLAGVSAFILFAKFGSTLAERKGIAFVIYRGMGVQIFSCIGMITMGYLNFKSFWGLVFFWSFFCAGLALRGPSTFTRALTHAREMAGKGAGLLMFLAFGICSVTTTVLAPYLADGLFPIAMAIGMMILLSTALSLNVQSKTT